MKTTIVKYPDVHVQLSGEDGNAFAIIGRVTKALKRAGHKDAATEFANEAMRQPSYDHLLRLAMKTVDVA